MAEPRIFFEEWHQPLISGIRWCSELVELVGGEDVCAESRLHQGAKGRIYDPEEVVRWDPEGVIASWCASPRSGGASPPPWRVCSDPSRRRLDEDVRAPSQRR